MLCFPAHKLNMSLSLFSLDFFHQFFVIPRIHVLLHCFFQIYYIIYLCFVILIAKCFIFMSNYKWYCILILVSTYSLQYIATQLMFTFLPYICDLELTYYFHEFFFHRLLGFSTYTSISSANTDSSITSSANIYTVLFLHFGYVCILLPFLALFTVQNFSTVFNKIGKCGILACSQSQEERIQFQAIKYYIRSKFFFRSSLSN